MRAFEASPGELLNALEGVAYIVDTEGALLVAGGAGWQAAYGAAAFFPPSAVFGRDLFELIQGEEVRLVYRALHDKVLAGKTQLAFEYRCDGPRLERLMRMSMGPIAVEGVAVAVLYHSTLLTSTARVPLPYLANDEKLRRQRAALALPVVTICAWCADVSDGAADWFKPEEHYRRGGKTEVQLSHGICPACRKSLIDPLLAGAGGNGDG